MLKVRLYRPFSIERLRRARCRRPSRPSPCSTAPRSRARSASRSTWTCVTALARGAATRARSPFAAMPARHRRPLRPVLEGVHPGDGQGGLRRARQGRAEEPLHRRHQRRRDAHRRCRYDPDFDIEPDDVDARACSSASAPTARSAPTRTRSRSSARRPTTTPRATSSTTRRSPARSPSRTCASARARSAPPT